MSGGAPEEIDGAAIADPAAVRAMLARTARPMVLRGLVAGWPAVAAAARSAADLRTHIASFSGAATADLFIGDAAIDGRYYYGADLAGFNFTRASVTVRAALAEIASRAEDPSRGTAYLGALPAAGYLPGFAEANPAPLAGHDLQPRLWIGNASHVACHYDATDNLACVVAGQRRFTLYPPAAIGDLYVGPIDHTMAGQPVSLAAEDPAHPALYPRFARAQAQALTIDLAPGDALYLPKLWWHQVDATGPFNAMINYWWDANSTGPDAPMLTMLLAMIALAERPAAEREAFRAFFDHYVFRPEGHPLAHLPEAQRGILRTLDRTAYGRIRATVMRELRGP